MTRLVLSLLNFSSPLLSAMSKWLSIIILPGATYVKVESGLSMGLVQILVGDKGSLSVTPANVAHSWSAVRYPLLDTRCDRQMLSFKVRPPSVPATYSLESTMARE